MAAPLAPGRRILTRYSNAFGEPLHERLVLFKSWGTFYAICLPDLDVYTECIGGTEDIIEFWSIALTGGLPCGLPGRELDEVDGFTDFKQTPGPEFY